MKYSPFLIFLLILVAACKKDAPILQVKEKSSIEYFKYPSPLEVDSDGTYLFDIDFDSIPDIRIYKYYYNNGPISVHPEHTNSGSGVFIYALKNTKVASFTYNYNSYTKTYLNTQHRTDDSLIIWLNDFPMRVYTMSSSGLNASVNVDTAGFMAFKKSDSLGTRHGWFRYRMGSGYEFYTTQIIDVAINKNYNQAIQVGQL